ncbi:MAG TPA: hemerythrin domain-containing protein [Streptosporangiaceae bacterium]|nr:hemerythrin domain-containing protein [Streptosporangiaceae bacterium]
MCEYCGCQSLAAIDELTREHELVVNLMSEVRAAHSSADTARMSELARQVAAVLGPHTEVEEFGLFPALTADFPDHVAALEAEHRHVQAVLDEAAAGTPADPAWPDRLAATLTMLREHILKEQDGVFPAALASLTTAQWEAVEAVRSLVGTLVPRVRVGARPAMPDRGDAGA